MMSFISILFSTIFLYWLFYTIDQKNEEIKNLRLLHMEARQKCEELTSLIGNYEDEVNYHKRKSEEHKAYREQLAEMLMRLSQTVPNAFFAVHIAEQSFNGACEIIVGVNIHQKK